MSEIYGDDLTPDAGTTLRKMLKKNLEAHMNEFEAISGAASKVNSKEFLISYTPQYLVMFCQSFFALRLH